MQAMPIMPKISANSTQPAGVESDSASIEGVDFSALLKAQIKGGKGIDAELRAKLEAVTVEMDTVEVGVQPELQAEGATLNGDLIPLAGIFMPIPAVAGKPSGSSMSLVLSAGPSGKELASIKGDPDVLGQLGREFPVAKEIPTVSGRVADFAVDGEELPQIRMGKTGEGLSLPVSSAEAHSTPEIPANTLPVMMATSHSSVVETKAMPLSPATIQAPVGSAGWGEALGQKVVWMAGQQTQVAELRLNPPNLGPMEVRISVSNDQISAIFVSHQPAVREAIEAAMPRLREMLAEGGMSLGNATVSSDSLPQQQASGREGQSGSSRQAGFSSNDNMQASPNTGGMISLRQDGSGMVDLFA
ncbi:MAG: flagellar hook-length control protein FliK [Gammaproteobacteria bacterium]|nr:flagellar hook-length control protein FliK [Gammaproteobacteria bacterium]MBU1733447.1 flagellar hook-length control protein FliK [Gammaproteobacteria bacterium]MBU1891864.1 flagellar hook-length control protein FliK [Gammaproteobacteria bacterium]